MSGTFSRKYPVAAWPFTLTPNSRSRSTQRHTVERDTPISRAIRAPLMTMASPWTCSLFKPPLSRDLRPYLLPAFPCSLSVTLMFRMSAPHCAQCTVPEEKSRKRSASQRVQK